MRRFGFLAAALLALFGAASAASAQDVAIRGEVHGVPLPPAYLEDVAAEPRMFSLPGPGWGAARLERTHVVEGTLPVLVIPALFSDSREPHVSRVTLQRVLFDGPAEHGTVTDFYRELSGGRLEVVGRVAPWVRTHLTLDQVTAGQAGFGPENRVLEYLWRALERADEHVDFGTFDNDGADGRPNSGDDDGIVDIVAFEFLEVSGSCGGPGIWPHRSAISWRNEGQPFESSDPGPFGPIRVDGYIVQSVSDCAGTGTQTANVIGHELGHVLGLPDLYHPIDGILPTERRWVVGCWGLMAAGSWGCGDPSIRVEAFGPIRMSPWSLARLGWVGFDDVGPEERYREFRIEPTIRGGRPLRIALDEEGQERLVLELRTREGFDEPLPAQGVLAYRWNRDGELRPERGSGVPYLFQLLEGDGNGDLGRTHGNGGNRGEASDVLSFPGNSPVLSAVTSPSTRRHSGEPTSVTIHRVDVSDGAARVWISTAADPGVVRLDGSPPSVFSPYVQFHRVGGGVPPFDLEVVDGPPWLTVGLVGDRLDLSGTPDAEGTVSLALEVTDAEGRTGSFTDQLDVGAFAVPVARLLGGVMASTGEGPTPLERQLLDERGNGNGRLDIGDVRAHLRGR